MYAIIETGGKQYKVKPGDVLDVESLTAEDNKIVNFDKVLVVADNGDIQYGTPHIDGALVEASLVDNHRGKKLTVFKMKRRKGCRRKMGHRQNLSRVEIREIKTSV